MELNCKNCGIENPHGTTYCTNCGIQLGIERLKCFQCETLNSPDSKFCGECGTSLARISEEKKECRRITVLFCDLVGSTRLSEHMELEEYWEFLEIYRDACCKVIREFHGYPSIPRSPAFG